MIAGIPKSARFETKVRVNAAKMAGRSNGSVTSRTARVALAPEMRAACSRSEGIRRSAALKIR